jgi:hypothetical protein
MGANVGGQLGGLAAAQTGSAFRRRIQVSCGSCCSRERHSMKNPRPGFVDSDEVAQE